MINGLIFAAALAATVTAPGPEGPLEGTFVDAGKGAPVIVIIPGSGPTDRDGNNKLGFNPQSYKLLAEALEGKGVSTIRVDKRGMVAVFGARTGFENAAPMFLPFSKCSLEQPAPLAR